MTLPLSGVTVIALEQAVAAPYCTARLADAGARVVKVERAEGDFARHYDRIVNGESANFVWLNRGKESIALDLKDTGDQALLRRMIGRADVLVQNLKPGALDRLGLDGAALRAGDPRLITVDISGYGMRGAYAGRKAYDLLVQAESGLASLTGTPEAPGRVGVSVCDIAAGMNAHAAVLEALIARGTTGRGRGIAVSLFDAMADWMAVPLLHHDYGGRAPPRVGLNHPSIAPYGVYRAGDGDAVLLAVQNEREWESLCRAVLEDPALPGDPDFADNPARVANRDRLDARIASALAAFDLAELTARLAEADIAFGRLNDVGGLSHHDQLRRMTVDTPSGPATLPAVPARTDDAPPAPGAVPAVDAHGAALRLEFADGKGEA